MHVLKRSRSPQIQAPEKAKRRETGQLEIGGTLVTSIWSMHGSSPSPPRTRHEQQQRPPKMSREKPAANGGKELARCRPPRHRRQRHSAADAASSSAPPRFREAAIHLGRPRRKTAASTGAGGGVGYRNAQEIASGQKGKVALFQNHREESSGAPRHESPTNGREEAAGFKNRKRYGLLTLGR